MRGVLAAALAALALVGAHLGLGGGDYEPARAPDPCTARAADDEGGLVGTLERIGLNALSAAACDLGVSRERLLLALAGDEPIGGVSRDRRTEAFRAGVRGALEQEEKAGRISGAEAFLVRQAVEILPVDAILEQLFD